MGWKNDYVFPGKYVEGIRLWKFS